MQIIDIIDEGILYCITEYLEVVDIVRLMMTCRVLYNLLNTKYFWKIQLIRMIGNSYIDIITAYNIPKNISCNFWKKHAINLEKKRLILERYNIPLMRNRIYLKWDILLKNYLPYPL